MGNPSQSNKVRPISRGGGDWLTGRMIQFSIPASVGLYCAVLFVLFCFPSLDYIFVCFSVHLIQRSTAFSASALSPDYILIIPTLFTFLSLSPSLFFFSLYSFSSASLFPQISNLCLLIHENIKYLPNWWSATLNFHFSFQFQQRGNVQWSAQRRTEKQWNGSWPRIGGHWGGGTGVHGHHSRDRRTGTFWAIGPNDSIPQGQEK